MANAAPNTLLKGYFERAERLQKERAEVDQSLKELMAEVKANGFDLPTFKEGLKVRAQDAGARAERTALLEMYLEAAR